MALDGIVDRADSPAAQQGNGQGQDFTPPRGFKGRAEKLMRFMRSVNIAEDLDDDTLANLGRKVVDEYDIDKVSRNDWEERNKVAMDLAMQVAQVKQYPWPNASNVKYPLLTTAAIQFAARAYPAIVQGKDVVKGKVVGADQGIPAVGEDGQPQMQEGPSGEDGQPGQPQPVWEVPPGAKRDKADRIARHMSWQLLEEMEDWEEDTDKLLHMLPIIGCVFRKTYFSRDLGRNVSELVPPMKLVVNNGARSLETVPRITQEFELYPYQITERVRGGLFLDLELGTATGDPADEDAEHEFLEQHRFIDLDEDDYPEPYVVTLHKETAQIVRITANYDERSVIFNEDGKVKKIERAGYFTKYPFIPSPAGEFYDIGFGSLLGSMSEAVNSSLNQLIDAGTLRNMGGGFLGRGARIKGGPLRFKPGEWKPVDTGGQVLRDSIVPNPVAEPSMVLFQLLGLLIEAGKEISSVKDVLTGEAPQGANTPATTTLALIEQGLQVFTAIYKRVYRAEKRELKKLFRLNQRYLPPESYFTVLDEPEAIAQVDYDDEGVDIVPVADPGAVSSMQKLAKAELLMGMSEDPYFNGLEIRKRFLEQAGIEDVDQLLLEQPPDDPKMLEAADKIDIEKKKLDLKKREVEIKEAQAGPETAQAKLDSDEVIAREKIAADKEIAREKINADLLIAREKIEADKEIAKAKIEADARIAMHADDVAAQTDEPQHGNGEDHKPIVLNLSVDAKNGAVKKHFDVLRNKKGDITGADVTEKLA